MTIRNLAIAERGHLQARHYVRKADPHQRYWFDFAASKVARFKSTYGDNFFLVIAGDPDIEDDYFAIPFSAVSHAFTDEFLSQDSSGARRRWVGSIERGLLAITHFPEKLSISDYRALPLDELELYSQSSSFLGSSRYYLLKTRVEQGLFRHRVLENFGNSCALSGISEQDLLVASHIVPWAAAEHHRLDPGNGILLYAEFDRLFDYGYISFDDDLNLIVSPQLHKLDAELQKRLLSLKGRSLRQPLKAPLSASHLQWHRKNVLRT